MYVFSDFSYLEISLSSSLPTRCPFYKQESQYEISSPSPLSLPHVGGPGVSMHLDIEATRITHRGPGTVPPPQAGAGCVAVAAPGVGPNQELAARVLGHGDKL